VGVRFVAVDRDDPSALRSALPTQTDLLVDIAGYTAAQAELLLPLLPDVGSMAFLSSKAVYVDDAGRHSNSAAAPQFAGPVTESQPTLPPTRDIPYDSAAGYGPNKVAAERVLLDSGHPVTVLRASKVHGEAAKPPREWFWVKRALDRRPVALLGYGGGCRESPSAAANIAALIETVAVVPGTRILNAADPDCPTTLSISRTIARHLDHDRDEVLLDGSPPGSLGWTPWNRPSPFVLDMTAAEHLGYRPVGDYAATVARGLDWLTAIAEESENGAALPSYVDSSFGNGWFDYGAEDAYLASAR
jgi:hypothetical protein